VTVRAIGPAVSWSAVIGRMPSRLTSPRVGLMPTTPLALAGLKIDPEVSVPTATVTRFALTPMPGPELEPPVCSTGRPPPPGSADTLRYQADRAEDLKRSRGALDAVYNGPDGVKGTADDFDAILASANNFAATPAKAGYPSITVPGGFVPPTAPIANPFPSGVTFSGPAFSEPKLIALAYAFEQATHHRQPPASTPPLPSDSVSRP